MRITTRHIGRAAALASLSLGIACADGAPTAPGDATFPTAGAAPTVAPPLAAAAEIDIDGNWSWHEVGRLVLTEEAAAMFGVTPEGPRTILNCESGGTLTIDQAGSTFTGHATQSTLCETRGGVEVVPPVFPPALDIVGGRIDGRHLTFQFGAGPVPCPYTASVRVARGNAVALVGTGRCIVPGHPQSPLPVPPPPTAPTKTIEWIATR